MRLPADWDPVTGFEVGPVVSTLSDWSFVIFETSGIGGALLLGRVTGMYI